MASNTLVSSRLLDLPAELRLQIYSMVFGEAIHLHLYLAQATVLKPAQDLQNPFALLSVCKQINHEIHDSIHNRPLHVTLTLCTLEQSHLGRSLGTAEQCIFLRRLEVLRLRVSDEAMPNQNLIGFCGMFAFSEIVNEATGLETFDFSAIDHSLAKRFFSFSGFLSMMDIVAMLRDKGVKVLQAFDDLELD